MAKIVIAGRANCPYYAKVELLADQLANSVDSFRVHKIVKTPEEWENWLKDECAKRKFKAVNKSPIVWRELVDRGGKGTLIGSANEFQEYALGYYGVKSSLCTSDITKIATENLKTKIDVDEEVKDFQKQSNPMKICITNAGSPVCYHLIQSIASGVIFGKNSELIINLLGTDADIDPLQGVAMEAMDLSSNPLRGVNASTSAEDSLKDCEVVVVLDELMREEEETEETWLKRNVDMHVKRITMIDTFCKKNVKVLIAGGGPINTSLYMMHQNIKNIDKRNIVAMPSLLENQAKAILARKVKVQTSDVVDVIVWGDNEKYFCDTNQARVHNHDGPIWGPPTYSRLASILIHEDQWLSKEFLESLQNRYNDEKTKMRHLPAFAHAAAINTLIGQWWSGSPADQMITLGVVSEGWYGVPEGMVFNFPARIQPAGQYAVVQDLDLPEESKSKIEECVEYLMEQRYQLFPDQRPPPPPEPEKAEEVTDSPHPPTMTPIREETDLELQPTGESSELETLSTHTDTEAVRTTSAAPSLAKIQEDVEPEEEDIAPEDVEVKADGVEDQPASEETNAAPDE